MVSNRISKRQIATHNSSPYKGLPDPRLRHLITHNGSNGHTTNSTLISKAALVNSRLTVDLINKINDECEYPEFITRYDYKALYEREPIAARVVDCLPDETWQTPPVVFEDEDPDCETDFEVSFDQLGEALRGDSWFNSDEYNPVWEILKRADKLSRIGTFGVLLIGIDDGCDLREPVEGIDECGKSKVKAAHKAQQEKLLKEQEKSNAIDQMDRTGETQQDTTSLDRSFRPERNPQAIGQATDRSSQDQSYPMAADRGGFEDQGNAEIKNPSTDKDSLKPFSQEGSSEEEAVKREVKTKRKLIYLRAFDESLIQITQREANPLNPRFDQPVMYSLTLNDPRATDQTGATGGSQSVDVHWTRVIHLAEHLGSGGEVFATPAMRPVFNRMLDLLKLYGGSAEMYWKGAFMGLSFETHPQLGGDVMIDEDAMKDQIEKYQEGLQRYLNSIGMSVNPIAPQVSDPSLQIDVQVTAICIQIDVPKRVFMGSEQGVLAADQDSVRFERKKRARRTGYCIPRIISPFIDRLIAMEVLCAPAKNYSVDWDDKKTLAPTEQADVALKRTQAIVAYAEGGEAIMGRMDWLTREMGFTDDEARTIVENQEEAQPALDEQMLADQEHELEMQKNAPSPIVGAGGGQPPFGGPPKPGDPAQQLRDRSDKKLFDVANNQENTENTDSDCGANSPGGGGFQKGNTCSQSDKSLLKLVGDSDTGKTVALIHRQQPGLISAQSLYHATHMPLQDLERRGYVEKSGKVTADIPGIGASYAGPGSAKADKVEKDDPVRDIYRLTDKGLSEIGLPARKQQVEEESYDAAEEKRSKIEHAKTMISSFRRQLESAKGKPRKEAEFQKKIDEQTKRLKELTSNTSFEDFFYQTEGDTDVSQAGN